MLLPLALALLASAPIDDGVLRRLRADVERLASDAMGGRDTGSMEVARAEELVAERFTALGLVPLPGRASRFVEFPLEREGFDPACTRVTLETGAGTLRLVPEVDFRPFDFSDDGAATAVPIVFAGYGITAPEHGWDDYAGLDVAGRAVLVLRHEPRETDPASPFAGTESTSHATFAEKGANARRHGAAALIVVTDPLHHEPGDDLRWGGALRPPSPPSPRKPDPGTKEDAAPLVAVQVARPVAERLVGSAGRTLAELQVAVDEGARPADLAGTLGRATLEARSRIEPEVVVARNVVAMLPGRDPALASEWIVVGAHHDHVGRFHGPGDTIFNGADDNASGTSAVLELARRFATAEERPRRSLVFATFSAEEKGLYGSKALVADVLPRERLAFMLNDDMLGRNPERPVEVVGDGFVSGLREIVEASAEGLGLSLQFAGDGYFGASDHEPFYEADVPFMFLFTGTHEDYHQVGDHAEKLDFGRMARLVELQERLLRRIADADEAPRFVHHVPWLAAEIEVRPGADGLPRAVVTEVEREGALRAGDAILAVAGTELAQPSAVGRALRAVGPGGSSSLRLLRDGERVDVAVHRPKPGWLGVIPGSLEPDERRKLGLRDDEGLVLRSVVAGGPAATAGLRDGDVLVRVDGRPINQRLLQARLAQIGAGTTVVATVLRDGRTVEMKLTPGERR